MHNMSGDDFRRLRRFFMEEMGALESKFDDRMDELFKKVDEVRKSQKKGPIVICSSQRFKEQVGKLSKLLNARNFLVYPPNFRRHLKTMIVRPEHVRLRSESYANRVPALAYHHFQNLRVASLLGGVCFIYNEDGYIGKNTLAEMSIAHDRGMPVFALMPHFERLGKSKKLAKGEVLINYVLINHEGTVYKRPTKNGASLQDVVDWLEQRVK